MPYPEGHLGMRSLPNRSSAISRISACWLRASRRVPGRRAFWLDFALPSTDVGPVDFSQGFVFEIMARCFALRSAVHADLVPTVATFYSVRFPAYPHAPLHSSDFR